MAFTEALPKNALSFTEMETSRILHPDPYGRALYDYFLHGQADTLWLHTSYGETEEMPVDWFYREEVDLPRLERLALSCCRGRVLDIGAGVGSHALMLQEAGLPVEALESSAWCARIMRERGVENVVGLSYRDYRARGFDTLLMLMNGIGIVGSLDGLRDFLKMAHSWLNPGGRIILDSSDIAYLYEDLVRPSHYYGQLSYCYAYRSVKGEWFDWLYVDFNTLAVLAQSCGWRAEQLAAEDTDQYLAVLYRI
jgi:SAM-dependent methyltransferase